MNFISQKIQEIERISAMVAGEFSNLSAADMDKKPAAKSWSAKEFLTSNQAKAVRDILVKA